jgi:hypothetical protein
MAFDLSTAKPIQQPQPTTQTGGGFDLSTAKPATDATSDPDIPYYRAPGFAGQSYFHDEYADIKQEEQVILKNWDWKNPDYAQKLQANRQREKQLFEDQKAWKGGYPEELSDLEEVSVGRAIAGDTPTGKRTSGKEYSSLLAMEYLAPEEKDKVAMLESGGWEVEMINGFPKVTNPKTGQEYALNKPGFSKRDFSDFLAQAIQFSGVGPAVRGVSGIGKKALIGGTVSALTEGTKQGLEKALGGEVDGAPIALAGLFGGASELAIPVLGGIWRKLNPVSREKLLAAKSVDDIKKLGVASESELKQIQKLIDDTRQAQIGLKEATGVDVDVFRGQATGLPSDLLAQRFLGQIDPTSKKVLDSLKRQDSDVYDATVLVSNQIASEETIEFAGKKLRDASEKAIAARRAIQKQASSPIYKQAFRRQRQGKVPLLNMSRFDVKYRNIAKQFDPKKAGVNDEISESLKDIVRRVDAAGGDLRQLHNVKMHIDRMLEKTGEDGLARSSKRFLRDVKSDLVDELTKQSPSYRAARSEFIRTQGPIDELLNSIVGKVSSLSDDQLDQAASKVFNQNVTPEAVRSAKKVIQEQDPEAWNQIVRRELFRRVGGIQAKVAEQGVENISNTPGELKAAIFGNENQRRVLLQSLEGEPRKNLLYLEKILESTASGRAAGSPTTPFAVIRDKLMGSLRVAKQAITSPLETVAKVGDETIFNRNARALADIMFDPKWIERMSEVRALGNSKQAATKIESLLEDALRVSTQAQRNTGEEKIETSTEENTQ